MANNIEDKKIAGIYNSSIKEKTGKSWEEWLDLLDHAGAQSMKHPDIAAYLSNHSDLSPWWQQMVTNGYERERKNRKKYETPDGFQVSKTKTIPGDLSSVYKSWHDNNSRKQWLEGDFQKIRTANKNKNLRGIWQDGTPVDVDLVSGSAGKVRVTVQQRKLQSHKEAQRRKSYWGEQLNRLKNYLDSL